MKRKRRIASNETDEEDEEMPRRSHRSARRIQYDNTEADQDFEDAILLSDQETHDDSSDDEQDDQLLVEKIIGRRYCGKDAQGSFCQNSTFREDIQDIEEEYLIKWKSSSYLHCNWMKKKDLKDTIYPRIKQRISRYLQSLEDEQEDEEDEEEEEQEIEGSLPFHKSRSSHSHPSAVLDSTLQFDVSLYFNPDYCRIDRIVAHREHSIQVDRNRSSVYDMLVELSTSSQSMEKIEKYDYLIKWKGLQYEESTWESYEIFNVLDPVSTQDEYQRYWHFATYETYRRFYESFERSIGSKKKSKKRSKPQTAISWKSEISQFPNLPFPSGFALRSYQIEGVAWLRFNWSQQRNSILADEMGLGKTIQIVSFLKYLRLYEQVQGPFLVIAPLSTLQHWRRECEQRGQYLNCVVYHGNATSRQLVRNYEFRYESKPKTRPYKFDVLVTSFEMVLAEARLLGRIEWEALIVDESHRLKNRESRLFRELFKYRYNHCVLLTGTPVQNSIEELWTLLHFVAPSEFEQVDEFTEKYGEITEKEQVDELHLELRPYLLRRLKNDVEKDLPKRQEIVIDVELTPLQKQYYKAVYEKNTSYLLSKTATALPSLKNIGMQLRKCCNHPWLIRGVEDAQVSKEIVSSEQEQSKKVMELLVKSSGKCMLLDILLPKLKSEGHRVLLFSQMTRMLDILEDYIIDRHYEYERIDGRIRGDLRQAAIDNFSKQDSEAFIFLLCTRAGGVGLNLTAADTCIIFDSDWNPQNDLQAMARCHRIGQTQQVTIYRLITKNTYEMHMFDRASRKLGLDQAILHPMSASTGTGSKDKMSRDEVEKLLKHGAYYALQDEETGSSTEYQMNDIEEILKNQTRLIEYNNPTQGTGSSFSKASFVVREDEEDQVNGVAIDDPNFWEKMGLKPAPVEQSVEELLPRKRKRVQRFGDLGRMEGAGGEQRDDSDYEDGKKSASEEESDSEEDEERAAEMPTNGNDKVKILPTGKNNLPEASEESKLRPSWKYIKEWTPKERDSLIKGLLAFGMQRWSKLETFLNLRRSTQEYRCFSVGFIRECVYHCQQQIDVTPPITHLLTSDEFALDLQCACECVEIDYETPPVFQPSHPLPRLVWALTLLKQLPVNRSFLLPRFRRKAAKDCKKFAEALELVFILHRVATLCKVATQGFQGWVKLRRIVATWSGGPRPYIWWSFSDDLRLLHGSYLYGFKQIDHMNMSTELEWPQELGWSKPVTSTGLAPLTDKQYSKKSHALQNRSTRLLRYLANNLQQIEQEIEKDEKGITSSPNLQSVTQSPQVGNGSVHSTPAFQGAPNQPTSSSSGAPAPVPSPPVGPTQHPPFYDPSHSSFVLPPPAFGVTSQVPMYIPGLYQGAPYMPPFMSMMQTPQSQQGAGYSWPLPVPTYAPPLPVYAMGTGTDPATSTAPVEWTRNLAVLLSQLDQLCCSVVDLTKLLPHHLEQLAEFSDGFSASFEEKEKELQLINVHDTALKEEMREIQEQCLQLARAVREVCDKTSSVLQSQQREHGSQEKELEKVAIQGIAEKIGQTTLGATTIRTNVTVVLMKVKQKQEQGQRQSQGANSTSSTK